MTPRNPQASSSTAVATSAPTASGKAPAKVISCTPDARKPIEGPGAADRQKGVKAIAGGRAQEALKAFERVMEQNPSDIVAFTLHFAASADLTEERERAGRGFARLKPPKLDTVAPPHKNLANAPKNPPVTLKKLSEDRHSGDWFAWLSQAGIPNPVGYGGEGEMPAMFGQQFGDQPLYASYVRSEYAIVRYGPGLLVLGQDGKGMRALNLEPFLIEAFKGQTQANPEAVFPEVRFAEVSGSTLVTLLAHEGDGSKVKPNGAVVAIDLEKDKPLWVSDGSMGNAYASYMTGTHYVTAFTDGTGGKVNVIDLATGETVASEQVSMRVDYVVGKGTKVYGWGYERAIAFELSAAPPVAPAKLGALTKDESGPSRELSEPERCLLENAVLALQHRDGKAVLSAVEQMPERASATRALRAAGEFLAAREKGTAGIDLTEKAPTLAEWVPNALVRKDAKKTTTSPKRFTPAKDPAIQPQKPPFTEQPLPLYSSMRLDVFPPRYGIWNIEGGFSSGDNTVLVYERRFIVTLKNNVVQTIVDMKPLLGESATQVPTSTPPTYFVTVIDGVVYAVVNAPNAYGSAPSTSYVVALEPTTGKVLWRSAAGMLTRPFLVFGEYLLSAQNKGTGSELQFMRLYDGQIVQSQKLKERVVEMGWDGRGVLFVNTATGRQYYGLK